MAYGAAVAGPDHQQIIRLAGGRDQHLPGFAAEHLRLGRPARRGNPAPGRVQRGPHPEPGVVPPDLAQVAGGMTAVGQVAARRQPGQHGDEGGVAIPRHARGVTQGLQVAR